MEEGTSRSILLLERPIKLLVGSSTTATLHHRVRSLPSNPSGDVWALRVNQLLGVNEALEDIELGLLSSFIITFSEAAACFPLLLFPFFTYYTLQTIGEAAAT